MAAPDVRPGDVLTAEMVRDLYARTEPPRVRGSGGVTVRQGRHGQVQVAGEQPLRFVGVANGDISPRAGSAWGTGKVTRYALDGTGNDYSTGQDFDVVNPSSQLMTDGHGIDSGQYCWVEEDSDGNLVVTPLECS